MNVSRFPIVAAFAIALLVASATSGAQTSASQSPSATMPSDSSQSATTPSDSSSRSPSKNQGKDTSRGAKEQQSQKHPCPKNGDNSNVNCKETGKTSKE